MEKWLFDSTALGSLIAGIELKNSNPGRYSVAVEIFRSSLCRLDATDELIQKFNQWIQSRSSTDEGSRVCGVDPKNFPCFLHLAASAGDSDTVNLLLGIGIDIDVVNESNETAILFAFRSGKASVAAMLIERGANLNIVSTSGETPLHWLSNFTTMDLNLIMPSLVANSNSNTLDMRVRSISPFFRTMNAQGSPLDTATNIGRIDVVSVLMELGADPFRESLDMLSPIVQAASYHLTDRLAEFLKYDGVRARINDLVGEPNGGTLLYHALYCATSYRLTTEHGSDWQAMASNTIRLLHQAGARFDSVDPYGRTALQVAVTFSNERVIELLLDLGCQGLINVTNGETPPPIFCAMRAGRPDIFKLLCRRNADTYVWFNKRSLLHWCASDTANGLLFATQLGDRRSDIDSHSRDEHGMTPFQIAVVENNLPVVDLLLRYGADPQKLTARNTTTLDEAISSSDPMSLEGLKYLVTMDPTSYVVQPKFHTTALHSAAQLSDFMGDYLTNRSKFLTLLRAFPSEKHLNARSKAVGALPGGLTPLHFACETGNYFAASELLLAGAKFDIKDDAGGTALDRARKAKADLEEDDIEILSFELNRDETTTLESLKGIIDLLENWSGKTRAELVPEANELEKDLNGLKFSQLGFRTT